MGWGRSLGIIRLEKETWQTQPKVQARIWLKARGCLYCQRGKGLQTKELAGSREQLLLSLQGKDLHYAGGVGTLLMDKEAICEPPV